VGGHKKFVVLAARIPSLCVINYTLLTLLAKQPQS
jgi:hypothetical protein